MSNFSSFFPTAGGGGGGGFTKQNKYSTSRALNDATHKLATSVTGLFQVGTKPIGTTTLTDFQIQSGPNQAANELVGSTFVHNATTHTITSNGILIGATNGTIVFTPGFTAAMSPFTNIVTTPSPSFTVNPATDLGLADGASLGYFMVGGGNGGNNTAEGGAGGRILQRLIIVTTAATNLTLTIGTGGASGFTGTASTITGGLTLTTTDGSIGVGWNGGGLSSQSTTAGQGINGYGSGGAGTGGIGGTVGTNNHGFGGGGDRNTAGGDGAILLYY